MWRITSTVASTLKTRTNNENSVGFGHMWHNGKPNPASSQGSKHLGLSIQVFGRDALLIEPSENTLLLVQRLEKSGEPLWVPAREGVNTLAQALRSGAAAHPRSLLCRRGCVAELAAEGVRRLRPGRPGPRSDPTSLTYSTSSLSTPGTRVMRWCGSGYVLLRLSPTRPKCPTRGWRRTSGSEGRLSTSIPCRSTLWKATHPAFYTSSRMAWAIRSTRAETAGESGTAPSLPGRGSSPTRWTRSLVSTVRLIRATIPKSGASATTSRTTPRLAWILTALVPPEGTRDLLPYDGAGFANAVLDESIDVDISADKTGLTYHTILQVTSQTVPLPSRRYLGVVLNVEARWDNVAGMRLEL